MTRLTLVTLTAALPLAAQTTAPTFATDIAPIVWSSCSRCHRPGEAAPFPLLSYADVRKRGRNLLVAIEDRYMPPWHPTPGYGHFRNEARLSDAEIATFRAWVAADMPEGDPESTPPLPPFTPGWQLGEPDLVVTTQGAFPVPADGRDLYRNFVLPLDLPEDRWLAAVEVRPSAPAVLHHTILMLDEVRQARAAEGEDGRPGFRGMRLPRADVVAGWAVGGTPEQLPQGLGIKIPAHSDLVIQSHFHPSGKPEREQTAFGLHFTARRPERTLVPIQLPPFFGFGKRIDIAPGERDYRIADSFELPCAVEAITVGGHAHLLCKSMKLWANAPDGSEIPLLEIREWDFDWQDRYVYAEPVALPRGARIHAEIVYDNSADNPNNPHRPPARVRWGRETTDEMGSLTLMVVPADEGDLATLRTATAEKNREALHFGRLPRLRRAVEALGGRGR